MSLGLTETEPVSLLRCIAQGLLMPQSLILPLP